MKALCRGGNNLAPTSPFGDGDGINCDRINVIGSSGIRSGCKDDNEREISSISSLSPLPSLDGSPQFDIDFIEVGDDSNYISTTDSSDDGGSSGRNHGEALRMLARDSCTSQRRLQEVDITRPGNPAPPSASSSSSNADQRSNSSSGSLIQNLLRRRRRPPRKIYLPTFQPKRGTHSAFFNSSENDMLMTGNDSACNQKTSAAERHRLLRIEVASLQSRRSEIRNSLNDLDKRTRSQKSELLRTLAMCGGDAKRDEFKAVIKKIEPLRAERLDLEKELDETSRLLKRKTNTLERLAASHSPLPTPLSPSATPATTTDSSNLEGQWFTLTKPTYLNCLGFNDSGDPMYTLGWMSFEMFRPGDLVLSIEAVFNPIEVVSSKAGDGGKEQFSVPKTLQDEVRTLLDDSAQSGGDMSHVLRTYHIVTAFVIEPHSPSFGPSSPNAAVRRPIRGIMTTYGYALPDPDKPDRLSVWFSGGKMECGEPRGSEGFQAWKKIFGSSETARADTATAQGAGGGGQTKSNATPSDGKRPLRRRRRTFREGAMVMAAKLLMGAEGYDDGMDEDTGTMEYRFNKPVGGHGKAYVDVLHLDERTRVMRGHAGTLYVFARVGKR